MPVLFYFQIIRADYMLCRRQRLHLEPFKTAPKTTTCTPLFNLSTFQNCIGTRTTLTILWIPLQKRKMLIAYPVPEKQISGLRWAKNEALSFIFGGACGRFGSGLAAALAASAGLLHHPGARQRRFFTLTSSGLIRMIFVLATNDTGLLFQSPFFINS